MYVVAGNEGRSAYLTHVFFGTSSGRLWKFGWMVERTPTHRGDLMRQWVGLASLLALAGCASSGSALSGDSTPRTASADAAGSRIARLKRSFDCEEDRASGTFSCTVKDGIGGSLVRKRIEPVVTSTGAISLRSVYRDRDWIYHDRVIVRIGEVVLRSDAVPVSSPRISRREIRRTGRDRDDYVSEHVSYRGSGDNGIIRAIAEAGRSAVTMQLAGGPRTFEKTLSDDEKTLFAEAYELSRLLGVRSGRRDVR